MALLFILVYSFIIDDNDKIKPNFIVKGFFFCIFLAIVALLYTSEYLTWNPVGNYWVNGIQPRYFIPMLLLLAVVCNINNIKVEKKIDYRYIYITVIAANLHAIVSMFNINDKIGKIISQILVMIGNYIISKLFVFKKGEK